MTLLYILFGIAILAGIGYLFGGKQAQKHGPARVFLYPILQTLREEYPNHELIAENDGRVKYLFKSTSFSLTADFIYFPNYIQVAMAWDSMLGKQHKVQNCPYDTQAIELAIKRAFEYFVPGFESVSVNKPEEIPLPEKKKVLVKKNENSERVKEVFTPETKVSKIDSNLENEIDDFAYKVIANILSYSAWTYNELIEGPETNLDDDAYDEMVRRRALILSEFLEMVTDAMVIMPKGLPDDIKDLFIEIKMILSRRISDKIYDSELDEELLFELAETIHTVDIETMSEMFPFIDDAVAYARSNFENKMHTLNSKKAAYNVCASFFDLENPAPDFRHLLTLEENFKYFNEFLIEYLNKYCMKLTERIR